LGNLAETDHCAHVALRWEAIAADGTLFIALDAGLMLVPAGNQTTALALAGAYRPQPGPLRRRAGPGDRAPACPGGDPQLRGSGGACARPPCAHGGACRPQQPLGDDKP